MSVRAKFKVTNITRSMSSKYMGEVDGKQKYEPCEIQTIRLMPVTGGSEENKKFFLSSPSGSIELGCVNAEANEQFVLDKEYYIDFTHAA